MHINPLHMRQEPTGNGGAIQTSWGYDRGQNAVRLGYCANFLAALMGLVLIATGHIHAGVPAGLLVGASFGFAYVAEQMPDGKKRSTLVLCAAAMTVAAYLLLALFTAFGE